MSDGPDAGGGPDPGPGNGSDPKSNPDNIEENINPFLGKAFGSIALGFAYYYNEILTSWQNCGSDNLCKTEKLVQYVSVILGVARPAILLSKLAQNWLLSWWERLTGRNEEELGFFINWISTGLSVIIYSVIEFGMSYVLDWVRYATECLKQEDCERDDILIWIKNMKIKHCEKEEVNDEDYNTNLECDKFGGDCLLNDTDDPDIDWCVAFFNELPILMLVMMMWVIYMLSIPDYKAPPPFSQPRASRKKKEAQEGSDKPKSNQSESTQAEGKSEKSATDQSNKNENSGTGDKAETSDKDKSDKSESNETKDKSEKPDDNKKGKTEDKSATPDEDNNDKNDPTDSTNNEPYPKDDQSPANKFQEISVLCPCCKVKYVESFPDPLPMPCDLCKPNKKKLDCSCGHSKTKSGTKYAPRRQSARIKNSQPKTHHGEQDNDRDDFKLGFNISGEIGADSVDTERESNRIGQDDDERCHLEKAEAIMNIEGDDDQARCSEEGEWYELYASYAGRHRDELVRNLEEPVFCAQCNLCHIDHVHALEEDSSESDLEQQDGDGEPCQHAEMEL